MESDRNEVFRQATLRICSSLDIEKALFGCLRYIGLFMPATKKEKNSECPAISSAVIKEAGGPVASIIPLTHWSFSPILSRCPSSRAWKTSPPERHDTSRGFLASQNSLPVLPSTWAKAANSCSHIRSGNFMAAR